MATSRNAPGASRSRSGMSTVQPGIQSADDRGTPEMSDTGEGGPRRQQGKVEADKKNAQAGKRGSESGTGPAASGKSGAAKGGRQGDKKAGKGG